MHSHHPDWLVAELASSQYGVVTRRQLLQLGLGREAIAGRIRTGRLHRLHGGVYAVGHSAIGRKGRWMAAVMASGQGAVLSHRSAAALWGLQKPQGGAIEITTPRTARPSGSIIRRQAALASDEVTTRRRIPVTTVSRLLLDLAVVLPAVGLQRVMREVEYLRLLDRHALRGLPARYPGRRGICALRECLRRIEDQSDGRTRSPLETRFAAFVERSGLPEPQLNTPIRIGRRTIEADCLWRSQRLIVELDGHAAHGTRSAFEDDRDRDRRLQAAGWRVVRVTWRQLRDEAGQLERDLCEMLGLGGFVRDNVQT
jgi:very-short-patch-repair endonuclease